MEIMENCPSGLARVQESHCCEKSEERLYIVRTRTRQCFRNSLNNWNWSNRRLQKTPVSPWNVLFFRLPNHWNRKKCRLHTAHRPRNFGWIVEHGPINPNFNGTCRREKIAENTNCMTSEYASLFRFGIFCFAVISKCSRSTHDTKTHTHIYKSPYT